MRRTLAVLLLFSAVPLTAVEIVATRCSTETVHVATSFDVRRIGTCGDDQPANALWFLDRLDSIDGSLDGHYTRSAASALVYVLDSGVEIDHDEFVGHNVTPAQVEQRLEATPSFVTGSADGTSGKVVYVVYPPEARRRAVR